MLHGSVSILISIDTFSFVKIAWHPFAHVAIDHQLLTVLEQWKASRHRLLWVAVVNRNVGKWDAPWKYRHQQYRRYWQKHWTV